MLERLQRRLGLQTIPGVFFTSVGVATLFVALAVPFDQIVADSFGLAVSRYGTIRLGADDSRPDYSNLTWFTMLFAPTVFTLMWFGVFGLSAIQLEMNGQVALAEQVQQAPSVAIFAFLEAFSLAEVASALSVVIIVIFFTTSSDSASLVIDMLTRREDQPSLVRKYLPLNRNATLHVVAGSAGEKLVALAGQLCIDLMILVSRGGSGHWPLRRATVEYVAVNAPCPVLVLPSVGKA